MGPAWPFRGPVAFLSSDIGREDVEKRESNETGGDSGQTNKVNFAWDEDDQEKENNPSEAWISLVQVGNAWHEKEEEEDNVGDTKISMLRHLKSTKDIYKKFSRKIWFSFTPPFVCIASFFFSAVAVFLWT